MVFQNDFGHYTSHSFTVGYALGQEENEIDYSLEVYPNPSEGIFNLSMDNFKGDQIDLTVYTELGGIAYQETISDNNVEGYLQKQIDLSALSEGIYFVQVKSDQQMVTKRIVVQ